MGGKRTGKVWVYISVLPLIITSMCADIEIAI